MDFEALVRAITEKVLAELRASGPAPAQASGPRLLVLARREDALASRLAEVFGANAVITYHGEPGCEERFPRYVMPYLCCPDMAALATGRATGPITRKALDLLLAGEKVEVLELEYTRHSATAPQALYSLYTGYEKTLAAFGLVKFKADAPTQARLHEGLVTEKSVKEAAARGVKSLSVPAGAIVTALAQDAAKELGIAILKDGGI